MEVFFILTFIVHFCQILEVSPFSKVEQNAHSLLAPVNFGYLEEESNATLTKYPFPNGVKFLPESLIKYMLGNDDFENGTVSMSKEYVENSTSLEVKTITGKTKVPTGSTVSTEYLNVIRDQYPFIVSIQFTHGNRPVCSGSLITSQFVLTASHCLVILDVTGTSYSLKSTEHYVIVSGTRYTIPLEAGFQIRYPEKFLVHPNFKRKAPMSVWNYDYGFIQLKFPFIYTDHISTMPMYSTLQLESGEAVEYLIKNEKTCTVLGWTFEDNCRQTNQLSKGAFKTTVALVAMDVKLKEMTKCKNRLCEGKQIVCTKDLDTVMFICGMPGGSNYGFCPGDSGGPLICDNNVFGVISWPLSCAESNSPIIFSSIHMILPLIETMYKMESPDLILLNNSPVNAFYLYIWTLLFYYT